MKIKLEKDTCQLKWNCKNVNCSECKEIHKQIDKDTDETECDKYELNKE